MYFGESELEFDKIDFGSLEHYVLLVAYPFQHYVLDNEVLADQGVIESERTDYSRAFVVSGYQVL